MALVVLNGPVIEAGESISDGIDCSGGDIVRLTCPPDWTQGANLTFAISTDGNGYNDLFTHDGKEITAVVNPGAAIVLRFDWSKAINFLKVRSGTRDGPVVQKEKRDFAIAIEMPEVPPVAR
jgi:hypothetical protein